MATITYIERSEKVNITKHNLEITNKKLENTNSLSQHFRELIKGRHFPSVLLPPPFITSPPTSL